MMGKNETYDFFFIRRRWKIKKQKWEIKTYIKKMKSRHFAD